MHWDLKINLSAFQVLTGASSDVSKEAIKSCFQKSSLIVMKEEVPAEPIEGHNSENFDGCIHRVWPELS